MSNQTGSKALCRGAWAIPPSPLMLKHGNDYYTCSKCGKPCEVADVSTVDEQLDRIILDIAHVAGLIQRGKTINADWFPEQQATLKALLVRARIDELEELDTHWWHDDDTDVIVDMHVGKYIEERIAELQATTTQEASVLAPDKQDVRTDTTLHNGDTQQ